MAVPERARPNIVLILADDLGWGDIGRYNRNSRIPTPNIDRLAGEGVRFTNLHSPSAVCTPTRYALLTGRYCWRSQLKKGVLNGYSPDLIETGRETLPSFLRQQGYTTSGVGKWHLGLGNDAKTDFNVALKPGPLDHGFDYFYGIPASLDMPPYLYFENRRAVEKPTSSTPGHSGSNFTGAFWRAGAMAPSFDIESVLPMLTAKAVERIRQSAKAGGQPSFTYFAMSGPHTPWVPTQKFRDRSEAGAYGDFVAQVDDSVGQVVKALDEVGAADNTLLIFTSDNGAYWPPDQIARYGHRSNNGWRGMKADIFEGGHRVPFIVRWPHVIPAGTERGDLACLVDVYATVAELLKQPLSANAAEDSFSQYRAMTGTAKSPARQHVVHHSSEGMFAVNDGRWKLIEGLGSGGFTKPVHLEQSAGEPAGQLYDLQNDPAETQNCWTREPAIVKRLLAQLSAVRDARGSRPPFVNS